MQISAAHMDAEGVRKWAVFAAERYGIETGMDSVQLAAINSVAQTPELAQAWGQRDPHSDSTTELDEPVLESEEPVPKSDEPASPKSDEPVPSV